mmetsp:Transcript_57271/g.63960  ORF Transcript_57271/g.63960 Transcript_57271/m.63960 type:complete len:525 (-) Transcript_57271:61-1635(-)
MEMVLFCTIVATFWLSTSKILVDAAGDGVSGGNKELVVIAGPHKTSETSVEEFFYSFARGDNPEYEKEKSLLGWSWPQILGLGSPHLVYDRLVTDYDDKDIQTKIINALVDHLDTSSRGLVMGGDEYDGVGNTIFSKRNAINVIALVKEATQIDDEDITIVLLYQHPRVEQWLSIYTHEIIAADFGNNENGNDKASTNNNFKDPYEEFLCNPETYDERWEILETAMNPFQLATTYLGAGGYNVVMIDLDGVRDAGFMIEHVIGCEVLGGTCSTDGWLDSLESESFMKYQQHDDEATHPFHSLTPDDVQDLERLFRLRDCNYQNFLENHPNFRILYGKSIFNSCPTNSATDSVWTDLQDTTKLYNVIQSQKNCYAGDDLISLPTILEKVPEVKDVNLAKYSDDADVGDVVVVAENNNNKKKDDTSSTEASGESVSAMDNNENTNEDGSDKDDDDASDGEEIIEEKKYPLSLAMQIVFVSTIVLWIGFMIRVQWKKNREMKFTQSGIDGIMPTIKEDRNRPLSEIM